MKKMVKPIVSLKESYERSLTQKATTNPKILNIALLSNPFLKDQDQFRVIQFQMTQYNKRINQKIVTDHYEVRCFQKMYLMICDLVNMSSRQDMIFQLGEMWKWWTEQRRIIKQRQQQGAAKYKIDRTVEKAKIMREKMKSVDIAGTPSTLPNDIRFVEVFPYEMDYRTAHKQLEVPLKRLSEYKRKIIHIPDNQYIDDQIPNGKDRLNYPMPKKYIPPEENKEQNNPQNKPVDAQNVETNGAVPNPEESIVVLPDTKQENQNQLNMEGFGEEPEPEEEAENEEVPQKDKLAPSNKIYTLSIRQQQQEQKTKKYEKPYVFYKGVDDRIQRRMEQRAINKMQYSLQLQREEKEFIQKSHEWAKEKSKIDKYSQMKLQKMVTKHNYSLSFQEPTKQQMISLNDQKKYGFYIPPKIGISQQISLQGKLPEIANNKPLEKQLRNDRLKSLKHKFSTLLNLQESCDLRETKQQSMCQISPRYRNFSMILQEHSREKEKLIELQQIQKIKENLGKQRININMHALSHALVPDSQESHLEEFQSPSTQLPSNPFLVEVKKKKK